MTKDFNPSVSNPMWSEYDGQIYFTADDKDCEHLFTLNPLTGKIHSLGAAEDVVTNYSVASHGGDLVFRIEDTDSHRFVPGAEEYIIESFKWLGIHFDEGVSFGGNYGPYRQSERRDIYKKYVKQLLDKAKAYIAFDTPDELDNKRKEIANFQYDASTRMSMVEFKETSKNK